PLEKRQRTAAVQNASDAPVLVGETAVWRIYRRIRWVGYTVAFLSAPETQQKLAGGEASPRAGTTGSRQPKGCAPEGAPESLARLSGAPSGAHLLIRRSPVVALADSLHHRLISVVPPAPAQRVICSLCRRL